MILKPFRALRPSEEIAERVAALPYDVYSREEAAEEVKRCPESFLALDRAETQFDASVDTYAPEVYEKARELLENWTASGRFLREETACYYVYSLTMEGRVQTGLVACSSVDDYLSGAIKKHENTRADKELDRINHVDVTSAQTGPIFLAYRDSDEVNALIAKVTARAPLNDFVSPDGIRHQTWRISDPAETAAVSEAFSMIPNTYIADGHHRAASAVKVALRRREAHPEYDGTEEYNYFLSVLFPESSLHIMDYNRVVRDLNGLNATSFLQHISESFDVSEAPSAPFRPAAKGEFGLYLEGRWYALRARGLSETDPVKSLDVSILQDRLLGPVLGIEDPKTDPRIDFVGGIRGLGELERRCGLDGAAAFSMYPTSMAELFAVADAGLLMPPKSTWFEPKLRSGLFIHEFER